MKLAYAVLAAAVILMAMPQTLFAQGEGKDELWRSMCPMAPPYGTSSSSPSAENDLETTAQRPLENAETV